MEAMIDYFVQRTQKKLFRKAGSSRVGKNRIIQYDRAEQLLLPMAGNKTIKQCKLAASLTCMPCIFKAMR